MQISIILFAILSNVIRHDRAHRIGALMHKLDQEFRKEIPRVV